MFDAARGRLVDLGYAAGWSTVKAVPAALSERAFRAVADTATVRNGAGARQLRKNLRRVVGPGASERELDELVGAALRSYSRYWLETFRLPKMDHDEVVARTGERTEGAQNIFAARRLPPHCPAWFDALALQGSCVHRRRAAARD